MNKLMAGVLAVSVMGFAGVANAAAGDSTFSVGYAQVHAAGLKKAVDYFKDTASSVNMDSASEWFIGRGDDVPDDLAVSDSYNGSKDPKGINLKYRYEITDNVGVISSFTYARNNYSGRRQVTGTLDGDVPANYTLDGDIKAKYFSVNVGPAIRFNDHISAYVMGGVAHSKYEANASESFSAGALTARKSLVSGSDDKTMFSWGAGLQVNPIKNIAIDVAYEGAGSGDWKTNGFNIGVGYSF